MTRGKPVKERDAQLTREKLVRASLRLFASQGYHSTKVSDIVGSCGVTQATFYWHFQSKLELVLELVGTGRSSLLNTMRRGYRTEISSVYDMVENSRRWFTDLLQYAQENREFMAILLGRGYGAELQIDRAIDATRSAMFEVLQQNIARAVDLGMLERREPDVRSALIHRLIEGSLEWWLFGNEHQLDHQPSVSREELAEQLIHFEFFGLSGSSSTELHASKPSRLAAVD